VAARGYEALRRLTEGRDVVWYGLGEGPGYCGLDTEVGEISRFTLRTPPARCGRWRPS